MNEIEKKDVLLDDEEYKKLLKEYVKIYSQIHKALSGRKKHLLGNFTEVAEKIIIRRVILWAEDHIENTQGGE